MTKNNNKKLRDFVIEYFDRGCAVFPLVALDKVPYAGSGGFKDATTDINEVEAAWH